MCILVAHLLLFDDRYELSGFQQNLLEFITMKSL